MYEGFWIGYVISILILGIVWGSVTNVVIHNKGYDENWFWWGFFFGFFALIIACTKPARKSEYRSLELENLEKAAREAQDDRIINAGGWKCAVCGKAVPHYTETCACGNTRRQNKEKENAKIAEEIELHNVQILKEYKKLLDRGIITAEEFENKKNVLIGKCQ